MWGVWTQISVFGGWSDGGGGGGGHSHYLDELQPLQLEEDLGIGPPGSKAIIFIQGIYWHWILVRGLSADPVARQGRASPLIGEEWRTSVEAGS